MCIGILITFQGEKVNHCDDPNGTHETAPWCHLPWSSDQWPESHRRTYGGGETDFSERSKM